MFAEAQLPVLFEMGDLVALAALAIGSVGVLVCLGLAVALALHIQDVLQTVAAVYSGWSGWFVRKLRK